jgi:hypothetical protein
VRLMSVFTLIVFGGIVVFVLVLLVIGRWHPTRADEITDKDRQKQWATQATIEEEEVGQMVEGQNVYRRARGDDEITEGDMQRRAAARQRESLERARRHESD